jgi:hypothetical protein
MICFRNNDARGRINRDAAIQVVAASRTKVSE